MSTVKELEEKVKELLEEIETLKQKENAEEFEYPFEEKEEYWSVSIRGLINHLPWTGIEFDTEIYEQGHVFKTREEAERERDKRALLTRFRQFRDKCNGDWKPFEHGNQFYISFDTMTNVIHTNCVYINKSFALFGYFKNKPDCERAIELFGKEIKRLWVDE